MSTDSRRAPLRSALPLSLLVAACGAAGCGDHGADATDSPDASRPPGAGPDGGGPPGGLPPNLPVLIQPTRVCRPALPGEPEGASENGEVCTWQAIAGATEQGRAFADYADCRVVRTQRPYYPLPPHQGEQEPDPRMSDEAYVEEVSWAASQIRTTGCACCHSLAAEMGPVRWTIDAPGNWVNTMNDRDLAASAEWISTSMFGRFAPEMNNGAERRYGFPSIDPERMRRFFENELAHRGRTRAEFDDAPPTGGPLLEQASYLPSACQGGEGVKAGGVIAWSGGPARYIYVLERGSANPTIPPNLDLPEGTLWRLDVPHDNTPLAPGSVRYGVVPQGASQDYPVDDEEPVELESGEEYYLYVTRDVSQPITRCIFKAP